MTKFGHWGLELDWELGLGHWDFVMWHLKLGILFSSKLCRYKITNG